MTDPGVLDSIALFYSKPLTEETFMETVKRSNYGDCGTQAYYCERLLRARNIDAKVVHFTRIDHAFVIASSPEGRFYVVDPWSGIDIVPLDGPPNIIYRLEDFEYVHAPLLDINELIKSQRRRVRHLLKNTPGEDIQGCQKNATLKFNV